MQKLGVVGMRVAICDDDNNHINTIENYLDNLKDIYPNLEWDAFNSGNEILKYINNNNLFDIIFLDLEMGDLNGIETARRIREVDERVIIIFVTCYKEYVYESFEVNPFRFLVKPISFDEFSKIFGLAYQKIVKKSNQFSFKNKGYTVRLYYDDIYYFESCRRKVYIYTKDSQYCFYARLKEILQELTDCDFIMVHKSFLINMNHIKEISYTNIKLQNNVLIPISESRRKLVYAEHIRFMTRSYKI